MSRDELTRLREARPEPPAASETQRTTARNRLMMSIDATGASSRFGLRLPSISTVIPVIGVVITLAVAAIFVISVRPGHHNPEASSGGAGRGSIMASNGQALAFSQSGDYLTVVAAELPASATARSSEARFAVELIYGSTSAGPGRCVPRSLLPPVQLACHILEVRAHAPATPTSSLFTASDPVFISAQSARKIRAEASRLSGLRVTAQTVREDLQGSTAAAVIGIARSSTAGALVGQSGLEAQYNSDLAGGDTLKTFLNVGLQAVGERSLATSIKHARSSATGGAFVAMNPENGDVYAMGSEPSYIPSVFSAPLTQAQYDSEFGRSSDDPLLNRAIQSTGPVGSTFKVITGIAALQSGRWTAADTFDDTGQFCLIPDRTSSCLQNSGHAAYGTLDLASAIKVSDDVFFYHLGDILNVDPSTHPNGGPLQTWARTFGIGQRPPIDLPYAASGTLPTPKYISSQIQQEINCDNAKGDYAYTNDTGEISAQKLPGYHRSPKHTPGGCGIAAIPADYWTVGDNIDFAVGQGDLQVSPLQLARVYAAIANGGKLVTPHIGDDIQTPTGTVIRKFSGATHSIGVSSSTLSAIDQGLRQAAQTGTSGDVMGDFSEPVYGKTGTAEYVPTTGRDAGIETDTAWYACFVPATATTKPIVVVVSVTGGGFGDVAAAPVARQILSQWFNSTPGPYKAGSSTDR